MKLHYLILNLVLAVLLVFVMPIYAWSAGTTCPTQATTTLHNS